MDCQIIRIRRPRSAINAVTNYAWNLGQGGSASQYPCPFFAPTAFSHTSSNCLPALPHHYSSYACLHVCSPHEIYIGNLLPFGDRSHTFPFIITVNYPRRGRNSKREEFRQSCQQWVFFRRKNAVCVALLDLC